MEWFVCKLRNVHDVRDIWLASSSYGPILTHDSLFLVCFDGETVEKFTRKKPQISQDRRMGQTKRGRGTETQREFGVECKKDGEKRPGRKSFVGDGK
jgi:hypothetical protein